ncbi:MAG TPA: hypothetical protein PLZ43_15990 [bacterium]|nr:hypothetical protein [bacterium]
MNYLGIDREIFLNGLNNEISDFVKKAVTLKIPVYLIDSDNLQKKEIPVGQLTVKNGKIIEIEKKR